MISFAVSGVRFFGDVTPPNSDNDNLHLLPGWMTPAEAMQWVRDEKRRLSRELAANARLWHCPEHRRTWDMTVGIEKMALRQCYGFLEH